MFEHGTEKREDRSVNDSTEGIRLQKVLSQAGVASRRAAEKFIADGRVSVNGKTILTMGVKVDPQKDDIRVDGRRVKAAAKLRYILLYKPTAYVTTRSDPQRRRTVLDLLAGVREYVYPVGRLDYDTEGLLLLTNDGDLAARLTHPRHGVARTYEARVAGMPDRRRDRAVADRHSARRPPHAPCRSRAAERGAPRPRGCASAHDSRGAQPASAAHVRSGRPPGPDASPHSIRFPLRSATQAGRLERPCAEGDRRPES